MRSRALRLGVVVLVAGGLGLLAGCGDDGGDGAGDGAPGEVDGAAAGVDGGAVGRTAA